jgi:hypothetical protein
MTEQGAPATRRERLQQIDDLQVNLQPMGHGHRSFPQTLLGVFENNPSARGLIVNFLRQSLFESGISLAFQRDQMRREVTALGFLL